MIENYESFTGLLNSGKISYDSGKEVQSVINMLKDRFDFRLSSSSHYFPIMNQSAIHDLALSFTVLFPILDVCYNLAAGAEPSFLEHIDKLSKWLRKRPKPDELEQTSAVVELLELDSYKFVRPGLWYQVLARDKWTCCSCRRSAKEHGIVLQHVDHILPRSLGGKDVMTNLQTLCQKCNLVKSNRDSTDLRS